MTQSNPLFQYEKCLKYQYRQICLSDIIWVYMGGKI